jgi:hypothetical protein
VKKDENSEKAKRIRKSIDKSRVLYLSLVVKIKGKLAQRVLKKV